MIQYADEAQLRRAIALMTENLDDYIHDLRVALDTSPLRALQWAGSALRQAALQDVALRLTTALDGCPEERRPALVRRVQEDALKRVLSHVTCPPSSSLPLMRQGDIEAAGAWGTLLQNIRDLQDGFQT